MMTRITIGISVQAISSGELWVNFDGVGFAFLLKRIIT